MTLIEQAQTIRSETVVGANTAERVGKNLEDIGRVSETLDTIADLKAYEDYADGQVVEVRGHTIPGIGGGHFKFKSTPLFSINNVDGYSGTGGGHGNIITMTITALQESLWADLDYGATLVFENGATFSVRTQSFTGNNNDKDRSYPEGVTSIRGVLDGTVDDGEQAFWADDNGVYIRPTFAGFDSIGVWERILGEDSVVTPQMYGAIPNSTPLMGAVNDSYQALQDCYDSQFDVWTAGGYFYTSQTVDLSRNKSYMSPDADHIPAFRRNAFHHGRKAGVIYVTTDIDVVRVLRTGTKGRVAIDTSQVTDHRSAGVRVDLTYVMWNVNLEIIVSGNIDTLADNAETGTRALVIDGENAVVTDNSVDVGGSSNGALHTSSFKVFHFAGHTTVHRTPNAGGKAISTNGNRFLAYSLRTKRHYNIEAGMANSRYEGEHNSGYLLQESQKDFYSSVIRGTGSIYDAFLWDRSSQPDGGLYRHNLVADFASDGIQLGPIARRQFNQTPGVYGNVANLQGSIGVPEATNVPIGFPKRSVSSEKARFGRLTNQFGFANRRGTVTVDTYEGAGYDFATETGESTGQPSAADVSTTNDGNFFDPAASDDFRVSFSAGADLTNDFVEIVASDFQMRTGGDIWVTFESDGAMPLQMQFIGYVSGSVDSNVILDLENLSEGTKTVRIPENLSHNSDKFILRLIGSTSEDSYKVNEIYAQGVTTNRYYPYIHAGGGQTILGNLNVDNIGYTHSEDHNSGTITRRPTEFQYKRTFTAAEIGALNTTPLTLLDANALGGGIFVKSALIKRGSGTTHWDTNTIIQIRNRFPTDPQFDADISKLDRRNVAFNSLGYDEGLYPFSGGGVELFAPNGDPSGGDYEFEIVIDYAIA